MGSINIHVEYPHPRQKVWRAITTPDAIAAWLMENDFEPKIGHKFTLRTDPQPGFDGIVHCEVLELVEPEKLSFSWRGGPIDTIATFELRSTAKGTELSFTQSGFEGVKSNLTRLILKSGSKKMYHVLLPAVLDRMNEDGTLRDAPPKEACDERGFWRVLVKLFAPILGKKPRKEIVTMRFAITSILSGVVMFAWSAVSWMALPLHTSAFTNFPSAAADANARESESSIEKLDLPKSGVYHYPGFPHNEDGSPVSDEEMNHVMDRMRAGPVISLMVYHADGRDPFPPQNFVIGVLVCIIAAGIATFLTSLAAPQLPNYGHRVGFVVALGAFVFFAFYAQSWLWWGYPFLFGIAETLDMIAAPLLAGLIIAKRVTPARRAATS